jgi:hypothetical protein
MQELFNATGAMTFDHKLKALQALLNHSLKAGDHMQKQQQADQKHAIKMASEASKAKQQNAVLSAKAAEAGAEFSPEPVPRMGMPMMAQPTNPEAGPNDTVPAMLEPGEAVIPVEAAQDPRNKPVIQAMIDQGRQRQQVKGYQAGTGSVSGVPSPYLPVNPQALTDQHAILLSEYRNAIGAGDSSAAESVLRELQRARLPLPNGAKDPGKAPPPAAKGVRFASSAAEMDKQAILKAELERVQGELATVTDPEARKRLEADVTSIKREMPVPVSWGSEGRLTDRSAGTVPVSWGSEGRLTDRSAGVPPSMPVETPKVDPAKVTAMENDETAASAYQSFTPESQAKAAELEASLSNPEVAAKALQAVEDAKAVPEEARQDFLGNAFAKIWGQDNSFFQGDDLTRFGLLMAGGLLTGGSFRGSLRVAGLEAIKSADSRRAAAVAAAAAKAKEGRDNVQELKKLTLQENARIRAASEALAKEGRTAARQEAVAARKAVTDLMSSWHRFPAELRDQFNSITTSEEYGKNPAAFTSMLVSAASPYTGAVKEEKVPQFSHTLRLRNGDVLPVFKDNTGHPTLVFDEASEQFQRVDPKILAGQLTQEEFESRLVSMQRETGARVESLVFNRLNQKLQPGQTGYINLGAAKSTFETAMTDLARSEVFSTDRKALEALPKALDEFIGGASDTDLRKALGDAMFLKRALIGQVIYKSDISDEALYRSPVDKKPPSLEALSKFAHQLEGYAERHKGGYSGAARELEENWRKLEKAVKGKPVSDPLRRHYEVLVEEAKRHGVSPFMWSVIKDVDPAKAAAATKAASQPKAKDEVVENPFGSSTDSYYPVSP